MEVKQLQGFVLLLVLVGMILGVGILTLDKFGVASREDSAVYNDTFSIADIRQENGNITENGAVTLTNDYVKSVSSAKLFNVTGVEYTLTEGTDFTVEKNVDNPRIIFKDTTAFSAATGKSGNTTEIDYIYKGATTTSTTMGDTVSAMTPIASTWLPLIVTVAALAIVLGLVIASFARSRR